MADDNHKHVYISFVASLTTHHFTGRCDSPVSSVGGER